MTNFWDAVNDCGLRDLPFEGYEFTYDNGQAGMNNRQSRIDRAMVTESWTDLFPRARLLHLEPGWSDHVPIMVVLDSRYSEGEKGNRPFRFEQMWIGEDGCEDTIRRAWDPGEDMSTNLMKCATNLSAWKGANIGKLVRDIKLHRKKLVKLNSCERTESNVKERREIKTRIAKLIKQEELFWRQRSRVIWLKEGDRNTAYFHRKARQRKQKNHIKFIINDQGRKVETQEGIKKVAVDYFTQLFASSEPVLMEDDFRGVEGRVTGDMNQSLKEPYTGADVLDALNQMHPQKAPGPDGMNALFFQTYWHIVGASVIKGCLAILNGDGISEEINMTHIVLIPKKKEASSMAEFRPISPCNVIYKIVSKVLANRLKRFLGDIVSENQSAFVPGRLITDNILVAFELFHYMKNSRGGGGHMALKLDMAKAYDRIEWSFLEGTLRDMGFDDRWCNRVMLCVRSVTYAVTINGSYTECFKPQRGLRQGDPLSPYLFILCAEVFSSMIRREMEMGNLHGIRIAPVAPMVSHLFFADDSIIFTKANEREARLVKSIINRYEKASGQLVSLDKTTVSFSRGTHNYRKNLVASILGVRAVREQGKYLGLPTVIGNSKRELVQLLKDKLTKRLQGWRSLMLSKAGREVLIKAVAQSIPTYAMSVFKLPGFFCDELKSLVLNFWWGAENGRKKIPWVAWEKLCRSKDKGGLGLRDFRLFNNALLGKQGWRLMMEDTSLMARVIKGKYFADRGFLEAELGSNPSFTWRSIWESKDVILLGARRRIGDGWSTKVWMDPWIPNTQSRRVLSPRNGSDMSLKVAQLMNDDYNGWNEELIGALFLPFEQERIRAIQLSDIKPIDDWCWDHTKDGQYSVRTAYHLLMGRGGEAEQSDYGRSKWLWNVIWKTPVIPRVKIFMWQLCHDALPTRHNIGRRLALRDEDCPFCSCNMETCLHVFWGCGWVSGVWEGVGLEEKVDIRAERVREWVEGVFREGDEKERKVFMLSCWAIWESRNAAIFEGKGRHCELVIRRVQEMLREMDEAEGSRRREEGEGGRRGAGWNRRTWEGVDIGGNGREETVDRGVWRGPVEGVVKINTDAGVAEGMGTGLGVVARNSDGELLWAAVLQNRMVGEAKNAEAEAILFGMKEAWSRGHMRIMMESDCQSVIKELREKKKGRADIFRIYDDIFHLRNSFNSVEFSFVRRESNQVAHLLAHSSPWMEGKRIWSDNAPQNIIDAILHDVNEMT
ncbi:uncharacterized protein LOC141643553 [Silene latifolia]|uniref:uncharacterized protein LOC141643553 n=1 Tax=Silene latifolia TaxID=37657 RepID=UPI003D77A263